jgi:hypothetical protein
VLAKKRAVLRCGNADEFSLGLGTMKLTACHSYCNNGSASALTALELKQ